MESKVFTSELDDKLIDLVRDNPVLYDFSQKNYKDAMVKNNVWKQISEELGREATECLTRWKTIRDSYRRHVNKLKSKSTTGSPAFIKSKYINKNLKFLDRTIKERTIKSNASQMSKTAGPDVSKPGDSKDVEESTGSGCLMEALENNEQEADDEETQVEDVENADDQQNGEIGTEFQVTPTQKRKKTAKDKVLEEFKTGKEERTKLMQELLKLKREKNESKPQTHGLDLFFQSMSEMAKTFPPHLASEARVKVCQVMAEIELKALQQQPLHDITQNEITPMYINSQLVRPNFRVHTMSSSQPSSSSSLTNSYSILGDISGNLTAEEEYGNDQFDSQTTFLKL